ncbi:ComEA family DNA-binding protein [Psychrobacter aestuarii]|uniref:Helix-hairpin-helix DNA-binding motif class 1 domain-containing protein n=1 Tax=Psychrobacter aestuarii TaxID=556327 RepID=A0ABP3FTJ3_9GAMM|nr:ComEA family DNA-binding protein [Psychrobacter aestuarii]
MNSTSVWWVWLLVLFGISSAANARTPPLCYADAKSAYKAMTTQAQKQAISLESQPININRASEAELTTLQGIGSSKARAIILYREMFGGFAKPEDITKVKGIGDATFTKNRARIRVTD